MVVCLGEVICFGAGEERGAAAVAFGENDFVEEADRGVGWGEGFAFVDEFVEGFERSVSMLRCV